MEKYKVGQTLNHPELGDVRVVQFFNNGDTYVNVKHACHVDDAEDGNGFRPYDRADGLFFVEQ